MLPLRPPISWNIYSSLFVHYYVHAYRHTCRKLYLVQMRCKTRVALMKETSYHNIRTVLQKKSDIDQNKFLQIDNHTSKNNVLFSYHIPSTAGMQDAFSGLIDYIIHKSLSILLCLSSSRSNYIVLDIMSLSTIHLNGSLTGQRTVTT